MIQIGVVGKTNVGKSSFFKAATMIDVPIAEYPFTTIDPNVGIGFVIVDCVCKEFGVKCSPKIGFCKDGKRFVPIKLIDVAGLVPGAHEGRGLGNQFLDDLRQAPVLIQVIDTSGLTDSEGKPTEGYDPTKEIEFLEEEIDMWFAGVIKKARQKSERSIKITSRSDLVKILTEQLSGLEIKKGHIEKALETGPITDIERFSSTIRKISKPIIIAANKIDLKPSQENLRKIKEKYKDILVVPTSAESEIALKKAAEVGLIDYLPGDGFEIPNREKLDEKQFKALEFIKREVIDKYGSTGVQTCINKAVFELLNHIVVYPVADINKLSDTSGRILPDSFLVPNGTTLKEFAFKIHTDIGEKFIGGLEGRTKRKLGADYKLKNNDVVEILFKH